MKVMGKAILVFIVLVILVVIILQQVFSSPLHLELKTRLLEFTQIIPDRVYLKRTE